MCSIFCALFIFICVRTTHGVYQNNPTHHSNLTANEIIELLLKPNTTHREFEGAANDYFRANDLAQFIKTYGNIFLDEKQINIVEEGTVSFYNKMIYRTAMTKVIYAYVIAAALEEKLIALDDPIYLYLPEFDCVQLRIVLFHEDVIQDEIPLCHANKMNITVRHLLTFNAGFINAFDGENQKRKKKNGASIYHYVMQNYGYPSLFGWHILERSTFTNSPENMGEIMEYLSQTPLVHKPGARYSELPFFGSELPVFGAYLTKVLKTKKKSTKTAALYLKNTLYTRWLKNKKRK